MSVLLLGLLAQGLATSTSFGHSLRQYFYFEDNYTQLNHGAYGGTPRPVIDAQYSYVAAMERDIDPFMNGPNGYRACILAARNHLAAMLNIANVNDTVLVDNASEAINDILRNFEPPLSADEYIFDLSTAYAPFVGFYNWLGVRQGVRTITAQIDFPVSGDESFIGPVRALLANSTHLNIRVAIISQIAAYPCVTLPVKGLVDLFHSYNIPVVVDGAHALGNIPFDVQAMGDIDYGLWNLHKWYFAPKSSALLYVRRDHQRLHVPAPSVVDNIDEQDFPDRFIWTGTRDRTPYCAIMAAKTFRDSLGGESAITNYTRSLALYAKHYLEQAWKVTPMAPDSMTSSMALVQIPTSNATRCSMLNGILRNKYGLMVSGFTPLPNIPCYYRISAQVYLDESDIQRLAAADRKSVV